MANRKRTIDEKVRAVQIALAQINVEKAAREAGVPASTLRYDLGKVKQFLANALKNQAPGPKPRSFFPPDRSTSNSRSGGMSTVWGKGDQERYILGVELAVDVDVGLVGCATGAYSAQAMQSVWVRTRLA